jgi:hypothetical protein
MAHQPAILMLPHDSGVVNDVAFDVAPGVATDRQNASQNTVIDDVDVLDFTDAPLAENTDGRNTGPTLDQAGEALRVAMRDPRLRALSIGELNPTRSAGDPEAIPRFIGVLADVLAAAAS